MALAQGYRLGYPALAARIVAPLATVADLRALGAVAAWERLRQVRPRLASGATLLQLEGATRGIRVTQLSPAERARLRLFVRLGRQAS